MYPLGDYKESIVHKNKYPGTCWFAGNASIFQAKSTQTCTTADFARKTDWDADWLEPLIHEVQTPPPACRIFFKEKSDTLIAFQTMTVSELGFYFVQYKLVNLRLRS